MHVACKQVCSRRSYQHVQKVSEKVPVIADIFISAFFSRALEFADFQKVARHVWQLEQRVCTPQEIVDLVSEEKSELVSIFVLFFANSSVNLFSLCAPFLFSCRHPSARLTNTSVCSMKFARHRITTTTAMSTQHIECTSSISSCTDAAKHAKYCGSSAGCSYQSNYNAARHTQYINDSAHKVRCCPFCLFAFASF